MDVDVFGCDATSVTSKDNNSMEKFMYSYLVGNKLLRLTMAIPLPFKMNARECTFRLMIYHQIPCYLEQDMTKALETFLVKCISSLNDKSGSLAIDQVLESPQSLRNNIMSWAKKFKEEHSKYSQKSDANEDVTFSETYSSLIHSSALETLLQLDNNYALSLQELLWKYESALKTTQEKHKEELEIAMTSEGKTDRDVSNVAVRQMEESQMMETYWSSELSQLQEFQKREYRKWIMKVHENSMEVSKDSAPDTGHFKYSAPDTGHFNIPAVSSGTNLDKFQDEPDCHLEESFTIHLGAQQKTMHNLRLICGHVLDVCRLYTAQGSVFSHPHRIQTAFSLYSESLTGIILLVDKRLDIYTGITKEFASICQQSTELHFPDFEKQICLIQQNIEILKCSHPGDQNTERNDTDAVHSLQSGDFYITKHSNLAEPQVAFHLIVDDSVKSLSLNSRHPCVTGLRHILHTAVRYNITTLTIPLLLFHEKTEEMTMNFCVKRAELILKCVKGFMMECASWSGLDSLNIQFMIPQGISVDVFNTVSSMLPSIFRISTPLDLTSPKR